MVEIMHDNNAPGVISYCFNHEESQIYAESIGLPSEEAARLLRKGRSITLCLLPGTRLAMESTLRKAGLEIIDPQSN